MAAMTTHVHICMYSTCRLGPLLWFIPKGLKHCTLWFDWYNVEHGSDNKVHVCIHLCCWFVFHFCTFLFTKMAASIDNYVSACQLSLSAVTLVANSCTLAGCEYCWLSKVALNFSYFYTVFHYTDIDYNTVYMTGIIVNWERLHFYTMYMSCLCWPPSWL